MNLAAHDARRRWSRLRPSFDVKINFILSLGIAILIAVGTLAYRSIETLVETGRSEARTYLGLERLEAYISSLRNAVAAQRKYLLTRGSNELLAYSEARAQVERELHGLRAQTTDTEQLKRLSDLQVSVNARLQVLDSAIVAKLRGDTARAINLLVSPYTNDLDARIDALSADFRERELRSLGSRRSDTGLSADTSSFLIT